MPRIIICANCGEEKKHEAKGLCGICYHRHYREGHREARAANHRRWEEENPEKVTANRRRYRERYRDRRLAYDRRWQKKNPEKMAANRAHWRRENPDKVNADQARRRARKRNLPDTLAPREAERLFAIGQAMYPDEKLHLDHIVPLSKGGGTTLANMHAIPARLNCSKRDALPQEIYRQEVLL